jgi:hypothetical protein
MYIHKTFPLVDQLLLLQMTVLHSIVVALVQLTPIEIGDYFGWVRINVVVITILIIIFVNIFLELLGQGRSFCLVRGHAPQRRFRSLIGLCCRLVGLQVRCVVHPAHLLGRRLSLLEAGW